MSNSKMAVAAYAGEVVGTPQLGRSIASIVAGLLPRSRPPVMAA